MTPATYAKLQKSYRSVLVQSTVGVRPSVQTHIHTHMNITYTQHKYIHTRIHTPWWFKVT